MKVSFDLDDTLFVSPNNFKTENSLIFPLNKIFKERLRFGTISLLKSIKEQNIQVGVYTTSFRSEKYIKNLFHRYGITLDFIINGRRHNLEVQGKKSEVMPSKYPTRYRIDLHIDDDISVKQNGEIYGFRVFLVGNKDDGWDKKILKEIELIKEHYQ